MSKKIVRYTGAVSTHYRCSSPALLIAGHEYEVFNEDDRIWQTDYTLKGINGHFNSSWFEDVKKDITHIAISNLVPTIGHRYMCSTFEFVGGTWKTREIKTSTVMDVHKIGDNLYEVTTVHSVYLVQIGKRHFWKREHCKFFMQCSLFIVFYILFK